MYTHHGMSIGMARLTQATREGALLERSDFSGEMYAYPQRPSSSISTDPNRRVILFALVQS